MNRFMRCAAVLALLTFAPSVAESQLQLTNLWDSGSSVYVSMDYTGDPSCTSASFSSPYAFCEGAFDGNNSGNSDPGEQAVLDFIATEAGANQSGWLTDPFVAGGVETYTGSANGPISFGSIYQNFVLALKGSNNFSLYYFTVPVETLMFSMPDQHALSHWTLYAGEETIVTVPEPGVMFLLSIGLVGMFVRRRRQLS
jgi:hypothetical protein